MVGTLVELLVEVVEDSVLARLSIFRVPAAGFYSFACSTSLLAQSGQRTSPCFAQNVSRQTRQTHRRIIETL